MLHSIFGLMGSRENGRTYWVTDHRGDILEMINSELATKHDCIQA